MLELLGTVFNPFKADYLLLRQRKLVKGAYATRDAESGRRSSRVGVSEPIVINYLYNFKHQQINSTEA
jgi:hypothetical protein